MDVTERTLQEIGKSLLVTLPKGWTKALRLRKGSKVRLAVSDHGVLTITPELAKAAIRKETAIPYDRFYARRFFRAYFEGNERITFTFIDKEADEGRRLVGAFLKKFMNVQVIEDAAGKVVAKCFRIDELSIEECLRRMHFLSMGMFDELIGRNDASALVETDEAITRFYYMLVMQVRRFLTEGKYTEENQISLIRAMDYRMVAEKVERMADLVKAFGRLPDAKLRKEVSLAKGYASRSFLGFLNRRYDDALELMAEHAEASKRLSSMHSAYAKRRDVSRSEQILSLLQIRAYSRDISMLVR